MRGAGKLPVWVEALWVAWLDLACACCMGCFTELLQHLCKNAFIDMAVTSHHYVVIMNIVFFVFECVSGCLSGVAELFTEFFRCSRNERIIYVFERLYSYPCPYLLYLTRYCFLHFQYKTYSFWSFSIIKENKIFSEYKGCSLDDICSLISALLSS